MLNGRIREGIVIKTDEAGQVLIKHCLLYTSRVTDDTMFMRYDWYKEKRKNDISRRYNWTGTEVRRMQHLRHEGYSIREIAEMMNRSESSIKYKLYRRSNNGST